MLINKILANMRFIMRSPLGTFSNWLKSFPLCPPLEDVIMGKNTAIKKIMKGDKALLKKSGVRQKSFHSLEKSAMVWVLVVLEALEISLRVSLF